MRRLQPYVSKKRHRKQEEPIPGPTLKSPDTVESNREPFDPSTPSSISDAGSQPTPSNFSELPSRIVECHLNHNAPAVAVRWSPPYGQLIASAGLDGHIYFFRPCERTIPIQKVWKGVFHDTGAKDAQWSLDGTHLLSCGFDGNVFLYDVGQEKLRRVSFFHYF
jgi:WD40 repeat protein